MSLNGRVYDVQQGALKVRKTFTVSTLALAIFVLVNPAQAAETGSGTTGTANTAASGSQQDRRPPLPATGRITRSKPPLRAPK